MLFRSAANIAGADHNKTGWLAMAFGWTLFVIPFLFVFSTTLLWKGDLISIAVDTLLAIVGVWFISASVMGYSVRNLTIVDRLAYAITGICTFMPDGAFGMGRWFNVAGVVFIVLTYLRERGLRTKAVAA